MTSSFLILRPHYVLLVLPLLLILLLSWFKPKHSNAWSEIIDKHLLNFLMPHSQSGNKRKLLLTILLIWCFTVIAIMGPSLTQSLLPQHKRLVPRVILLDLSVNMMKKDLLPNRLERAKFKIQDFLGLAKESETSLIAFTEEPFLVTPFTEDSQTVTNLLLRLQPNLMPIDGQNIQHALDFAKKLFEKNEMRSGEILLVTGSIPNQSDFDKASELAKLGFHTSILGVGTNEELPNRAYQTLASSGHGVYQRLNIHNADIQKLLTGQNNMYSVEKQQHGYQPQDDGYYIVFIIMLFVLFGFRRGLFEQLTRT